MKVTAEHIRQYEDEGYTIVKDLMPRDACAAVRARSLEVIGGQHDWPPGRFHNYDPRRYVHPDGKPIPAGLQHPSTADPIFKMFTDHPNLQGAMRDLLGGEVQLFTDQMGYKYGKVTEEQGSCSYYHQDSYYWRIDPLLGCNCWIALDVVGKEASALAILPGTHKSGTLVEHESYFDDPAACDAAGTPFPRLRIPRDRIDFSKEVLVPVEPGDGVFFGNYTWHRAEPNYTGRDLCFYAIAYRLTPAASEKRLAGLRLAGKAK